MLSDEELIRLIEGGESDRVEFTSATKDPDKFRQAICAFANDLPGHGKPGVLFVGLTDDGCCAGVAVDDALLQKLCRLRSGGKMLPCPVMEVDKRNVRGCDVAVIHVAPLTNSPAPTVPSEKQRFIALTKPYLW